MEELIDVYDENRERTGVTIPRSGAHLKEGEFMLYVLAIVENAEGKYLITQRALDKSWAAGWWEVTGGGVLAGETLDISGQPLVPVYAYKNVDLERGDNYIVDIYHFHLDVCEEDVTLQASEAIGCKLVSWDEILQLAEQGVFLHFARLRQALEAEGVIGA